MRRRLGIIGISLLLVLVCCSGCDQFMTKPEHVTVNVMTAVYIRFVDEENNEVVESPDGLPVTIEMTKQGTDRLVFHRIVQQGLCQGTGSYEVSKGESILCTATATASWIGFSPVGTVSAQLSWETINASANFGGMYHWYPELTITMKKES
jgi:hypothetical protein